MEELTKKENEETEDQRKKGRPKKYKEVNDTGHGRKEEGQRCKRDGRRDKLRSRGREQRSEKDGSGKGRGRMRMEEEGEDT